jgi:hypothetical protein
MPQLSTAARNAACNAIVDLTDAGSTAGLLKILTVADAVLATLTLNDPAFGNASTGVATLDVDPQINCNASADGTAYKFTISDSSNTVIVTGDCGVIGSGADLEMGSLTVVTGQLIVISSLTFTVPAGSVV